MTTVLLMISFLLHVVTIAAIYFLYQRSKSIENNDSKEMIELMETYIEEMKEENIRLQTLIQSSKRKEAEKHPTPPTPKPLSNTVMIEDAVETDLIPPIDQLEVEDQVEASLEARVLQLHDQGYSITDIAKKLNCGKTEAELIIQLNKKSR